MIFFLISKFCHSGTQLYFCALSSRLCGFPCHKGSVSTMLLCHLKDLTKSRWHLRILFSEQLAQRPPCQLLTPAACIPQITSSRILRNIPQVAGEKRRSSSCSQPYMVVLILFFFFQQRVLMILWEEIRRGLRSSKSIPLPIDHIYGAEQVFQLKGKQDLPRGSHFIDKADEK